MRHSHPTEIPPGLRPYFHEYDLARVDLARDADLVLQRGLEFGTWEEVRWLFEAYGKARVRLFLQQHGERLLRPVTFHYWRKLLGVRKWKSSPLPTAKGELWNR